MASFPNGAGRSFSFERQPPASVSTPRIEALRWSMMSGVERRDVSPGTEEWPVVDGEEGVTG